jgi:hypothetical protein
MNAKQKQVTLEKTLDKCPDKNAKLSITLSAYIKEEVQPDTVSQRSSGTISNDVSILSQSVVQQPDFKKKKIENGEPLSPKHDMNPRVKSI